MLLQEWDYKFGQSAVFNPPTISDILDKESQLEHRRGDNVLLSSLAAAKEFSTGYAPNYEADSRFKREISHSFGPRNARNCRRLEPVGGTPQNVGPNSYHPDYRVQHNFVKEPQVAFPKAKKIMHSVDRSRYWDTWAVQSAVGKQLSSKNRSENEVSFGKAVKGNEFVGIVERRVLRVPLRHAVY